MNFFSPFRLQCAQGRAAWLERGRRCSVQDANQASFNRRWVKRNRVTDQFPFSLKVSNWIFWFFQIQDSSLGGSSDDEDILGVIRGPSTFANAFLYIGLGTASIGLIIAFVGTGEKGFKTNELRLIGPALIGEIFAILTSSSSFLHIFNCPGILDIHFLTTNSRPI